MEATTPSTSSPTSSNKIEFAIPSNKMKEEWKNKIMEKDIVPPFEHDGSVDVSQLGKSMLREYAKGAGKVGCSVNMYNNIIQNTPYKGLLVFHGIGSGKITPLSESAIEKIWKNMVTSTEKNPELTVINTPEEQPTNPTNPSEKHDNKFDDVDR